MVSSPLPCTLPYNELYATLDPLNCLTYYMMINSEEFYNIDNHLLHVRLYVDSSTLDLTYTTTHWHYAHITFLTIYL